jgi:hypothetical protein
VHARPDGTYPDGEGFFLECILQTIHDELDDLARPGALVDWLAVRRRQLGRGELLYIAHQLDFAGRAFGW